MNTGTPGDVGTRRDEHHESLEPPVGARDGGDDERSSVALCVDCDGTLIRTDLLHEGLLLLCRQSPRSLPLLPFWLLRGKAYFKARIAERVAIAWETLPYSARVIELVRAARSQGRTTVLATASPAAWAQAIASHVGVFDRVESSDGACNLSGDEKARRLSERYDPAGYDYIGNDDSDLPVWAAARTGIVVSSNPRLIDRAQQSASIGEVVSPDRGGWRDYLKALRLHQWLKNLLVLVPLMASHRFGSAEAVAQAAIAFLSFSLCASAVYVLNDLLDLEADRQHPRKRHRPLASARIPVHRGAALVPLLLLGSLLLALILQTAFLAALIAYFAMTLAYSLRLKRQVVVDVFLLAALYTMRLMAGAAATQVRPSFWLLASSIFLFLSLAIVKRYSEMQAMLAQNKSFAVGRGYSVADLPVLLSLGVSAGMASALVLALYINDDATQRLYPNTVSLWLVPALLLYWVSRVWMKTTRHEMDDDPVVFAMRDWQSLLTVALVLLCFIVASA